MIKKSKKKKHLEKLMSVSSCVGAEFLMQLLGNYRRNNGIITSITVGVVGKKANEAAMLKQLLHFSSITSAW